MECRRCRHENRIAARFCEECGTPLIGSSGPDAPEASYGELTGALSDARNREKATSEILRIIGTSPTDAQPIFDGIARSGVRLCGALGCAVFVVHGDMLHVAATHGIPPDRVARFHSQFPAPLVAGRGSDGRSDVDAPRAVLERRIFHLADIENNPEASQEQVEMARLGGYRTRLMVPMVRGDNALGLIAITSRAATPFTDEQVALLQTFADHAVIAIENVRLFKELEEKNRALTEAHAQVTETLEQQTATSEILRVISTSPTDVQPVFDAIAESSLRLLHGFSVIVWRYDGERLYPTSMRGGLPGSDVDARRTLPMLARARGTYPWDAIIERAVYQIADVEHETVDPIVRTTARARGWRANLAAPMLQDGHPIGLISVSRAEPGRFSPQDIRLLQTFADQAVIAIENVRLFRELEARTADLTRSVEQLTALGEVGRAVSSTLDLETVLTTIVARAVQLSGLDGGVVFEYDEAAEEFVQRAAAETGGVLAQARRGTRYRKGEGVLGRTAITLEPVQVPDIAVPGAYDSRVRENLIESGVRAVLAVPMIHQGRLIGCLGVTRNRVGDFPAETIELLRTFATQSALAIQNARLFQEIENKSRQLEAASRHKSEFLANMSHELRTPLNAIIGFSEVLAERMFGDLNDKQAEYLQDILESGRHLLSLINDILDLAKIEAGRMELEPADFHLPSAIDNALILVRERASRRGITLSSSIDERLGTIRGDERKVKQVLLNLLSNALKFTPEGGRIDVGARLHEEVAEVSVADTGIGIAPADEEAVFEEFRQVGATDKKAEGTGLGLALSRKFIELHGGKIWVQSEVGRGSTFTFTLPVRP